MIFKVLLKIFFLFHVGLGVQDVPSNQKWAFSSIGIIYNDLMKVQQRLIHNYYSVQKNY
jgi:hypothetical protein